MSRELQPPVPISLVKIELPTVIKNEPPKSEIVEIGIDNTLDSTESEEEIILDVKDIDIVYDPICEESIKSEILESYHCESVETQVFLKAENSQFIKTENITQRNKTEDTSDEIVTKGTDQVVVKVQVSNEHSNALSNLETDEKSVLNFSKNLNGISVRSRKSKSHKKTEKEKIKVIKAPVIPVEAHEYISLAKNRHVCNHCQNVYSRLNNLKRHIKRMHREVTTMYQCPYCPYKSKWEHYVIYQHIILMHKNRHQWCQRHCNKCSYRTDKSSYLKSHNLTHLKPEEIQYFYCYHCSHKNKTKQELKRHIFRHHFKNVKREKRHNCNKCSYRTDKSSNLKKHNLTHLKPKEIQYFYCYHCSHKNKRKQELNKHIFRQHFKNVKQGKRHHCDKCEYKTYASTELKRHKLTHLKPEEIQYFYCYHCSYKAKQKGNLKEHIIRHFKKEQVEFDCYICNFMTPRRESIIKHIKKHSKVLLY